MLFSFYKIDNFKNPENLNNYYNNNFQNEEKKLLYYESIVRQFKDYYKKNYIEVDEDLITIFYGNHIKAFINVYLSIEKFVNIIKQSNQDINILIPNNFEFQINTSNFNSYIDFLNSSWLKTILFKIVGSNYIDFKINRFEIIENLNKNKNFNKHKLFFFKCIKIFLYKYILKIILFSHKPKKILGCSYIKKSNLITLPYNFYNINFDIINSYINKNEKTVNYKDIDNNVENLFLESYKPWIIYSFKFFEKKLFEFNLNNELSLLATDSNFVENQLYKYLVYYQFKNFSLKSKIISHGATYFFDTSSWIYSSDKYFEYYTNGSLEIKNTKINLRKGYTNSRIDKQLVKKNPKVCILYLYAYYQTVRINITEIISNKHLNDIFLIIEKLVSLDYIIYIKPHRNTDNTAFEYNSFVKKINTTFNKSVIFTNNKFENLLLYSNFHLFTYFSTGWLQCNSNNINAISFNPSYLNLNLDNDVKNYLNLNHLNKNYFENIDILVDHLHKFEKNPFDHINNLYYNVGIKKYLKNLENDMDFPK